MQKNKNKIAGFRLLPGFHDIFGGKQHPSIIPDISLGSCFFGKFLTHSFNRYYKFHGFDFFMIKYTPLYKFAEKCQFHTLSKLKIARSRVFIDKQYHFIQKLYPTIFYPKYKSFEALYYTNVNLKKLLSCHICEQQVTRCPQ